RQGARPARLLRRADDRPDRQGRSDSAGGDVRSDPVGHRVRHARRGDRDPQRRHPGSLIGDIHAVSQERRALLVGRRFRLRHRQRQHRNLGGRDRRSIRWREGHRRRARSRLRLVEGVHAPPDHHHQLGRRPAPRTRDRVRVTDHADDPFRRALEAFVGVVFTDGNSVTRLRNGTEIFPAMLRAVRLAQSRIDFVTYVYWTGDIARQMAYALAERARGGVEVRVLLDAVGAQPMSQELIDVMTSSGVELRWFRPPARWKVWEIDHRTHRKILVVDHQYAFTGGVGVAQEWEGDARNENEWRDTHFQIEGPAVDPLRATFLSDWRDAGGRASTDLEIPERPLRAG